jgi:hypothetical protein
VYNLRQGAQCHAVVFYNFALLVIDVPFLLLLLPLIVCGWRGAAVLALWRRTDDYWAKRRGIATQFLLLLFDLPAAVCLAVLLVSWRSASVARKLRALWISTTAVTAAVSAAVTAPEAEASTATSAIDSSSTDAAASTTVEPDTGAKKKKRRSRQKSSAASSVTEAAPQHLTSFHAIVFLEFGALVLDLPFVLASPLMLWRLPLFVKRLYQVPRPHRPQLIFCPLVAHAQRAGSTSRER